MCEKTTNISLIKDYASFNDFFFKEKITGVFFFCHWGSTFSGASFCPFNMYLSIGNVDYSIVFLIKMIEGTQKGP